MLKRPASILTVYGTKSVVTVFGVIVGIASSLPCSASPPHVFAPIGRLQHKANDVSILINGVSEDIEVITDEHSGSWFKVPLDVLPEKITITIVLKKSDKTGTLRREETRRDAWLTPSDLVDSDNPLIGKKAKELTRGMTTQSEKVQSILEFVHRKIAFKLVRGPEKDFKKASESLTDGYGICMNQARIFTALCRASHIPARIISGFVASESGEYHHDWVEFYDEREKAWIPLDPTATGSMTLNTLTYIGLLYSPDNNPIFPFAQWSKKYAVTKDGVSLFFPVRSLHWRTGRFGATRIETTPESIALHIEYELRASSLKEALRN